MAPKTKSKTSQKTSTAAKAPKTHTSARKPSGQALQVVDVSIGVVPTVAENVRGTADTWRKSETRSREIETLQTRVKSLRDRQSRTSEIEALRKRLGSELEKAEAKGGDVRREVTEQLIGRARKARERVEPVYRDRFEPAVKRVQQRI
jgi:hypothetical protein